VVEGGHAVNIVGYNDYYQDEFGNMGGFILRNTWADGLGTAHGLKARGSHSAEFYMQTEKGANDASACPNPHSPRSWTTCESIAKCKTPIKLFNRQIDDSVLELKCIDTGFTVPKGACKPELTYYLANTTNFGNKGLFIACFLTEGPDGEGSHCYPPLTLDDLATVFTPKDIEERIASGKINNKALCGFNFFSYAAFERLQANIGGITATRYDIEWTKSSYISNAVHPFNYSLIKKDTHEIQHITPYKPKWY